MEWKKLYIGQTSHIGEGLFARANFKKGSLIFTWEGILKEGTYPCYVGSRWLQIEKCQWIAPYKSNPGWYINHSCDPNSGIKNSIKIVAMRNIRIGEEITFDYSTSESENGWYLACHCGNKNCRGIIRSYEFLSTELKRKYRGFISEYLKPPYIRQRQHKMQRKLSLCRLSGTKNIAENLFIYKLERARNARIPSHTI